MVKYAKRYKLLMHTLMDNVLKSTEITALIFVKKIN
jgi:hypothetical protein